MARLPLDQGIPRFKANEERIDIMTNGNETATWRTADGTEVPSVRKMFKDINTEGEGWLAKAEGSAWQAEQAAAISVAASRPELIEVRGAKRLDIASGVCKPLDVIDGILIGTNDTGSHLYRSTDSGETWTVIGPLSSGSGEVKRVVKCADGEVLALRNRGIVKSVGWPAPSSWESKVTLTATAAQFIEWSIDGDGTKFMASEYGVPRTGSQSVWWSGDAGETWSVRVDKASAFPSPDGDTHFHGLCYDRWQNLWILCLGDVVYKGVYWSDDDGLTWTEIPIHQSIIGECQATTVVATPQGFVLGSDSGENNGMYRILRRDNPADMVLEMIWRWPHRNTSVRGFAFRSFYDEASGLVYTTFRTDFAYAKPIITWSNGKSAGLLYEYEDTWVATDGFRNVVVAPNGHILSWISRAAGNQVVDLGAPLYGSITPSQADTGLLLGGKVNGGAAGTAIGPDAVAAQFSLAAGSEANADYTGGMAIGWQADARGPSGTAVGIQAKAWENGTAFGRGATVSGFGGTALGRGAESAGAGVAVGRSSKAASSSVVIGSQTQSELSQVVLIGATALAAQAGVAVGYGAKTVALNSVALGFEAIATGQNTIAVGRGSAAAGNSDVAIGYNTISSGQYNTLLGCNVTAAGSNSVVIGESASATAGNSSVVIGRNAKSGAQWSVAIGEGAETEQGSGVAIGLNARSKHASAVAIGVNTETTIASSVAIGERDLDIAGTATKGIVMRSPNGTRYRVTVADGGSLVATAF